MSAGEPARESADWSAPSKLLQVLKWAFATGREPQAFLDAWWVSRLLDAVPADGRRRWALQLLTLSPHCFRLREPAVGRASLDDLQQQVERLATSRAKICEQLLLAHLRRDAVVIDYGCGPGFLAKALAPHVARVYACDISSGTLACARVLNADPAIEYLPAGAAGMVPIPAGGADLVVSIAVVQHVTDEELVAILELCRQKLKPGGKIVLHVSLLGDGMRSAAQWRGDRSLRGRIRYRYGLHCFGRDEASLRQQLTRLGFAAVEIRRIRDLVIEDFDDICGQHLLTAERL